MNIKLDKETKKRLKNLEKNLSYSFKKKELLFLALTHRSFVNEKGKSIGDNERYEFLGDAVLELAISHLLIDMFPDYSEGDLSKIRAAMVNERELAELARKLGLGMYLNLGKGEELSGGRDKPSLLSDALEAVLGAIYLDRGFKKAKGVISVLFAPILKEAGNKDFCKDYKTRLQEISQARFKTTPRYKLVSERGPDHKKVFEVNLFVGDTLLGVGRGYSKKSAEQEAARLALNALDTEESHVKKNEVDG